MDISTGWDLLNEIREQACREASNSMIQNTPRQHGLFEAIGELQEILPNLVDTRFTSGDLARSGLRP